VEVKFNQITNAISVAYRKTKEKRSCGEAKQKLMMAICRFMGVVIEIIELLSEKTARYVIEMGNYAMKARRSEHFTRCIELLGWEDQKEFIVIGIKF
jgi:hypothetical protein